MKDAGSDQFVPVGYLWSAEEVARNIADQINNCDWIPHQLEKGGYVVKTSTGRLVPAPTKEKET